MSAYWVVNKVWVKGEEYDTRKNMYAVCELAKIGKPVSYTIKQPYPVVHPNCYHVYDLNGRKVGEFDADTRRCVGDVTSVDTSPPQMGSSSANNEPTNNSSNSGGILGGVLAIALIFGFWDVMCNYKSSEKTSNKGVVSATKSTTSSNRAGQSVTKYVNSTETGHLNLRAEPNANAALLGSIPHGKAVNVVGNAGTGSWVRVRYNNMTGFVNGRFLSDSSPAPARTQTPPAQTTAPTQPPAANQPQGLERLVGTWDGISTMRAGSHGRIRLRYNLTTVVAMRPSIYTTIPQSCEVLEEL